MLLAYNGILIPSLNEITKREPKFEPLTYSIWLIFTQIGVTHLDRIDCLHSTRLTFPYIWAIQEDISIPLVVFRWRVSDKSEEAKQNPSAVCRPLGSTPQACSHPLGAANADMCMVRMSSLTCVSHWQSFSPTVQKREWNCKCVGSWWVKELHLSCFLSVCTTSWQNYYIRQRLQNTPSVGVKVTSTIWSIIGSIISKEVDG